LYEPIVKLEGVAKRFGSHEVLKDLSFSVPKGSVFAFLGNNGQGKSSTIRLMTGLLRADRGEIRIAGLDINKQRKSILAYRLSGGLPKLISKPDSPRIFADFVSIERSTIQGHKSGLGARRSPFFWKKARG
jgi:ABC-type multidrug transport system ATPase subunit